MPIGTSYLLFMQSMPEKFRAAEAFLYELRNAGSKFSLGRMIKFAAALGGPQKKYPINYQTYTPKPQLFVAIK